MRHWQETHEVFARASALLAGGGRCAIATVVAIDGSAYRRPGAKMLVDTKGRTWGGVSGGCLEADVREVALRAMRRGEAELRRYDTGADEDVLWGLGLGCEGSVEILVQPVRGLRGDAVFLRESLERFAAREPFAVLTALEGGAVRPGTASVLGAGGRPRSDRSAGPLMDLVAPRIGALLEAGQPALVREGEVAAFLDVLRSPPEVLLCGAGDDAIPLARAADRAGFRVGVSDHRPSYLTPARFPHADLLDPARLAGRLAGIYAVVMTHNLSRDRGWLRSLVDGGAAYIGLLGPRARREALLVGVDPSAASAVYGPVGLDLGADDPEQIAVSIVAEMLAVHSGRDPGHLRDRDRPIHDRSGPTPATASVPS